MQIYMLTQVYSKIKGLVQMGLLITMLASFVDLILILLYVHFGSIPF